MAVRDRSALPTPPSRPDRSDALDAGLGRIGRALVIAVALMLPVAAMGGGAWFADWSAEESVRRAAIEAALAYERLVEAPAMAVVDTASATRGRDLFMEVCLACHGADGRGVQGFGKTIVESDFVASLSDAHLAAFLEQGRPKAKPVAMPPKGGRSDLTAADLEAIVVYVRGLQDPRRLPELPAYAMAPVETSAADVAQALDAAGGDEELAQYIASGTKLYATTCIACHGPGGAGIAGNGKALRDNAFIQSLADDEQLLAFILKGRDPGDPMNTTGVGMPARGGNPALSEDDLLDISSYLRTLQPTRAAAPES
jgi:disulfide bond formation protein DsbB